MKEELKLDKGRGVGLGRAFKEERMACAKSRRQLDSGVLGTRPAARLAKGRVVRKQRAEADSEKVSI